MPRSVRLDRLVMRVMQVLMVRDAAHVSAVGRSSITACPASLHVQHHCMWCLTCIRGHTEPVVQSPRHSQNTCVYLVHTSRYVTSAGMWCEFKASECRSAHCSQVSRCPVHPRASLPQQENADFTCLRFLCILYLLATLHSAGQTTPAM